MFTAKFMQATSSAAGPYARSVYAVTKSELLIPAFIPALIYLPILFKTAVPTSFWYMTFMQIGGVVVCSAILQMSQIKSDIN